MFNGLYIFDKLGWSCMDDWMLLYFGKLISIQVNISRQARMSGTFEFWLTVTSTLDKFLKKLLNNYFGISFVKRLLSHN